MTPRAYLDAVRKRCEAATAGPCGVIDFGSVASVARRDGQHLLTTVHPSFKHDADFAAHAFTDIPKLERIARLAEDYREAVRKGNIESISADETRCALFAALEELK